MQRKLTGLQDKICDVAQDLWDQYLMSGDQADYKAYLDHIHSCETCFKEAKGITR